MDKSARHALSTSPSDVCCTLEIRRAQERAQVGEEIP